MAPNSAPIGPQRKVRRISVVIPAFNEERNIGPLLTFLHQYPLAEHPVESEVWVDVSGSTDRTGETVLAASHRDPTIHLVDSGRRDGLLRALDRLIGCATGDAVVRIDADLRLWPETIPKLIHALESEGAGIASPRIVPARSRVGRVTSTLAAGQWGLHDQVSRRAPKTTLVQAFWNRPIRLRPEAGLEDQALQDELVRLGAVPVYVPSALAEVLPPADPRDFVSQRVRSLHHLRAFRREGGERPPTAAPSVVGPAILAAIRERDPTLVSLAAFLSVEGFCRVAGRIPARGGRPALFQWEPISSTKEPTWAGSPPIDAQ